MNTLYIVSTPIGNLEDVTQRALRVLREADVILCEDTRVTKRLLERHAIANKQLTTYNEQQSGVNATKVIELLEGGKNVALVSDAGTPGISDPGAILVQRIREYFSNVERSGTYELSNLPTIQSVPGPSALTAAISIAGVPMREFTFLGFLPHKKGRETLFKEISASTRPAVFYESPHRILKTLQSLSKFCPDKKVVIARELTKIHEEILSGSVEELLTIFTSIPEKVRGEFVCIVFDDKISKWTKPL